MAVPAFPVYLFDLDGTIMDSATDICGAQRDVLASWMHPRGGDWQQRLETWLPDAGVWIAQRDVLDIETGPGGVRALITDAGRMEVETLVLCAGVHSGKFSAKLGDSVPLEAERGYHVMLAPDNVRFDLPVSPPERGLFFTPMAEGMRIAGTVELAAPHQPPSWHRADLLVRHLKDIFPGVGGAEISRWVGERPSLPDFRPAIGRAPPIHQL